jgi:GNAT superfamily N-acetyltransferase
MTIKLKRVTNKKDLREFIRIPFSLYRKNPYWVPPLIKNEMDTLSPGKNPAFEYCETEYWIAYKNNQPAGRIAVILNRKFNQKWKRNDVAFTRFDFIDEDEVSSALIKQAEEWARKKKAGYIHGPLGFTNFDQQGMLIKGFDEISTLASVYNFSYYPEHMERMNFHKEIDYVEYQVNTPENVPERAVRISNIVLKKYDLRLFKAGSKKELLPYSEQIFDVINQSYKDIFYSVKLTEKQVEMFKKKYLSFIDPEFVLLVLDPNSRVIGFYIAMPSLSLAFQKARGRLFPFGFCHILRALKNPAKLDLYLVGILPEYQNKGVNAVFMTELTRIAIKNGVESTETNSELETNKKVQAFWKYYEARMHKRKRVFQKKIQ